MKKLTKRQINNSIKNNKAGYMATEVACGWAGAVIKRPTDIAGHRVA